MANTSRESDLSSNTRANNAAWDVDSRDNRMVAIAVAAASLGPIGVALGTTASWVAAATVNVTPGAPATSWMRGRLGHRCWCWHRCRRRRCWCWWHRRRSWQHRCRHWSIDERHIAAIGPHLRCSFTIPPPGDEVVTSWQLLGQRHSVHERESPMCAMASREGCRER